MNKLLIPILMLLTPLLKSQNGIDTLNQIVIANAGEILESESYILNFTLGEVIIETFESNNTLLSQGFHQPLGVTITSVDATPIFGETIKIFPIPTENNLSLKVDFSKIETIDIYFYQTTGELLMTSNHSLRSGLININISDYPSGHYVMEIRNSKEEIKKSFKIIKH